MHKHRFPDSRNEKFLQKKELYIVYLFYIKGLKFQHLPWVLTRKKTVLNTKTKKKISNCEYYCGVADRRSVIYMKLRGVCGARI